ncbi:hypothetical protein F0363_00205 [Orientia tsutsugamushi]|nr:hypothetical protein F0363_00205 [Orientia tsutsugamushi]
MYYRFFLCLNPIENDYISYQPNITSCWINYFRVGNSSSCFGYVSDLIEKKVGYHLMQLRKLRRLMLKKVS